MSLSAQLIPHRRQPKTGGKCGWRDNNFPGKWVVGWTGLTFPTQIRCTRNANLLLIKTNSQWQWQNV